MAFDRAAWLFIIYFMTGIGLVWGLSNTRRIIQAPFVYAVGMLIILCPQLYVAANRSYIPDEAFTVFCIMVLACTIALYIGYTSPRRNNSNYQGEKWIINDRKLFYFGICISSIGFIGTFQISQMGEIQEWRGWAVYWITLSILIVPGISLILIAALKSKRWLWLLPALFFSYAPLAAILFHGRRSASLTLPLVYLLPFLIFYPKFRISRWAVLIFVVLAFVITYAFPYWRGQFQYGNYLQVVEQVPLNVVIDRLFSTDSNQVLEIVDGMITTGAHFRLSNYGLGFTQIYNRLIESYVPGSIIGQDFKDSLRIGTGISVDWVQQAYGIRVAFYTAKSAYTELFGEFSFLGCLVFFAVGRWFRQIYEAMTYRFDGRAIIFMCFFIALPASLPYSALISQLIRQLPIILIMLLCFKLCLRKINANQPNTSFNQQSEKLKLTK